MQIRTDLVTEQREMHTEEIRGATNYKKILGDAILEKVEITTQHAAEALQKPIGTYITITFGDLALLSDFTDIRSAIIQALDELLPQRRNSVLVVGLGNSDITPDAIGPLTANKMFATRHIGQELAENIGFKDLRSISALIPGVLGKTGIEALEIIRGTVERTTPDAVIVIDALAARKTERLCRTVQLCNTGISPGSGVHNSRMEISQKVLKIPVIAVGIPTVVDVSSLISDLTGHEPPKKSYGMMVTPKDIDLLIRKASELLSDALNLFLQPELDEKTLRALV